MVVTQVGTVIPLSVAAPALIAVDSEPVGSRAHLVTHLMSHGRVGLRAALQQRNVVDLELKASFVDGSGVIIDEILLQGQ